MTDIRPFAGLTVLASAVQAEDAPHVSGDKGIPALAMRSAADTVTTDADGDYTLLKVDEEGRLKVAAKQASFDAVTGTATAVGNTVAVDVRRASNVVFHVKNTGSVTLAAGTFVFEASLDSTNGTDGTWFGVQAARSNANTIETQIALSGMAAGAGYTTAWECSVNAYAWFRVRCSVAVTTNSAAFWTILRGTYATEPVPGLNSHAVTLSSTTLTSVTPAINADTTTNLGAGATYTGASRDAAATAVKRTVAATFYADVASAANGCLIDFSSDGTNWHPAASGSLSAGVPLQLSVILTARYWRVRMINGSGAQASMRITSGMFAI